MGLPDLQSRRIFADVIIRSWASIGGIICILSLALDPFFQQLIALPIRASLENRSRIPRTIRVDLTKTYVNNGSVEIGYNGALDIALGTYFIGDHELELANTTFFCPSDECSWPRFETLGICSRCQDIADTLEFGCTNEPGEWRREHTQVLRGSQLELNRTSCGWYFNMTEEHPMLMSGYSISETQATMADDALVMRILNMRDPLTNDLYWNGTMRFPDITAPIANFAIVNSHNLAAVFQNRKPDAYNCVMQWCTRTIEASFSHGQLTERVLSTFTNDTQVSDPLNVSKIEDYWDYTFTQDVILEPPSAINTFSVSNNSALSSRFTMDNWAPSFLTQANDSDTQWLRYMNGFLPSDGGGRPGARNSGKAEWIARGYIPNAMEDMAYAMTTALRNNKKISEDILGTGAPQVFVEVRWGWLAFPIALLVLSITFLLVTIWQMSSHDRVWKSSSLTVLVHGLSWDAKYAFRDIKTMRGIRDKAAQLQVYLNPEKEGGTIDVDLQKDESYETWDRQFVSRYLPT